MTAWYVMQVFKKRRSIDEEMNLVPLIDVIFILLIFFMITSQFRMPAIPVELPEAAGNMEEEKKALLLVVTAEKQIELEGEVTELSMLGFSLGERIKLDPALAVTLACDRSLTFDFVVRVLDELQTAGVQHVGIRHEQADP